MTEEAKNCPHCGASIKATAFACGRCKKVVASTKSSGAADDFFARVGCFAIILAVVVGVPLTLSTCSRWRAENRLEAAQEAREKAAKAAEKRQKGFHCLVPYLGYSPKVVEAVKLRLRDPDSFEHEETLITPVAKGRHDFVMRYRAKNGFGGINRSMVLGTLDHDSCNVITLHIG